MKKPNIILINCDDLGYGDLSCYGSKVNRTPHLDALAQEGIRFTDFYMASPVCSPSRGGMLTGCYPPRIGFNDFDGHWVLFPGQPLGLHRDEKTMASYLKDEGYATALVGKWHCGDQRDFLPTEHGFDHYFGIPYSNDMGRQSGGRGDWIDRLQEQCGVDYYHADGSPADGYPPLPLLRDDEVVQEQPDQAALTERYVDEATTFMKKNQDGPFFLYFAHMYVHLPIYVPQPYINRSQNGPYGAAVEHVDWSVGALLDALKQMGLEEDTLILFTSDNGSRARGEGGSNEPLRGNKGTTWEGGQRLPLIARWKGTIEGGQVRDEVVASIDFLPTFLDLLGREPEGQRSIDGISFAPQLKDPRATPARDTFCYYHFSSLEAIRKGPWKLHFCKKDQPCDELYHLGEDVGESNNLFASQPEVVSELQALADEVRQSLGDRRLGIEGKDVRPIGRVEKGEPLTRFRGDAPYYMAEYDLSDAG